MCIRDSHHIDQHTHKGLLTTGIYDLQPIDHHNQQGQDHQPNVTTARNLVMILESAELGLIAVFVAKEVTFMTNVTSLKINAFIVKRMAMWSKTVPTDETNNKLLTIP